MFSSTERPWTMPSALRSSGHMTGPMPIDPLGVAADGVPASVTRPPRRASARRRPAGTVSGVDKPDAMPVATASAANDAAIGSAREPRQPNGAKRAARRKGEEAA